MREFYSPLFVTDTTDIKNCKNIDMNSTTNDFLRKLNSEQLQNTHYF